MGVLGEFIACISGRLSDDTQSISRSVSQKKKFTVHTTPETAMLTVCAPDVRPIPQSILNVH